MGLNSWFTGTHMLQHMCNLFKLSGWSLSVLDRIFDSEPTSLTFQRTKGNKISKVAINKIISEKKYLLIYRLSQSWLILINNSNVEFIFKIFHSYLFNFIFLRLGLFVYFSLNKNFWSSCFSLLRTKFIGLYQYYQQS